MHGYFQSINSRLIRYVVMASTVLTLIAICFQFALEFQSEKSKIEASSRFIESTFAPIFTSDLWAFNTIELEKNLESVLKVDYVASASIDDLTSKKLITAGRKVRKKSLVSKTIPLIHQGNAKQEKIGILTVDYDMQQVYSVLFERFGVTVLSNFVKTLIIIVVIFLVFERVLTRHLKKLAAFLKETDLKDLNRRVRLDRAHHPKGVQDELELLENNLNLFLHQLQKSQQQLTEEYRHKETLQKKALELAHFAGVAEFSNGLLHNICNVLSISSGNLCILNMGMEREQVEFKDPKLATAFGKIGKSIEIAVKMITNHQNSHKGDSSFDFQQINLQEFLGSCVELMHYTLKKFETTVEVNLDPDLSATTSPTQLVNILINLLKNSCEAMENNLDGTRLITVEAEQKQDFIEIKIVDRGIGFDDETASKLFTFGYTQKMHGNGIGIHSCRDILRNMGGDLVLTSPGQGKGACATVRIPQNQANSNSSSDSKEPQLAG